MSHSLSDTTALDFLVEGCFLEITLPTTRNAFNLRIEGVSRIALFCERAWSQRFLLPIKRRG